MSSELIATIGLETHVQLKTNTKIWCGCKNNYGDEPNTNICPVCLGYPGALPVLNREAVRFMVQTGHMLGCEINLRSKHDRKSYFYPDMPKNYQITQFDEPLCLGGGIEIEVNGEKKFIRLNRIHLEEDVAKNTHFGESSGVDFNRAGTPLMEIVTEPDISSPDEAMAYLQALKSILQYGEVSDCNLEEGNIRCDINVSVAAPDAKELGTKAEIKNMNTFKGVHRAMGYEIKRQIKEVSDGKSIIQETRRWDDEVGMTQSMRIKEDSHDYRYFPDPDLMPIVLTEAQVEEWTRAIPELPQKRKERFMNDLKLPEYDAGVLVADKEVADFYEATAIASGNPKAASNWIMGEMLRVLSESESSITSLKLSPEALADLIKLVDDKTINNKIAKELFNELVEKGGDPKAMVEEKGLVQVSDAGAIDAFVDEAISSNPGPVADYQGGNANAIQFLVGQVMRFSKGKANPQMAAERLKEKLDG